MVNEHAGELIADGLGQQCGGHGGIDAAGECEQHLTVADLRAYLLNSAALVIRHRPVADRAADLVEEVMQHLAAIDGMVDLGMELHAIEAALLVADADGRAGGGMSDKAEALRNLRHIVAVAHPRYALGGNILEKLA